MNLPPTIPEGLDIIETLNGTVIRRKWLTWMVAPMLLFAVFWDGFLIFWYTTLLSKPNPPLMAVLFPLGHLAVGVGITYYVIASLFNKTDIRLDPSCIEVVTGPVRWIGNKRVMSHEIRQVLVRTRSVNRGATTYTVMYAGDDRKERKLVRAVSTDEQAEFIAEMVRLTLGLPGNSDS